MKHCRIFLLLLTLFTISPMMAINMKVGDTKKLDIGNIPYLQSCHWTISRPNDVVFTSTPHQVQTEVEIKAVKAFPATSPCIVQCEYYYLELDPTTGRYIYSRTGYKDWTIFVKENGSSDEGGGGDSQDNDQSSNLNITLLGSGSIEVQEGSSVPLEVGQGVAVSWSSDDESIAKISKVDTNKFNVYGVSGGMTYVRVNGANGSSASCLVRVVKDGEEGSVFYDNSPEGVSVKYIVTDKAKLECMVGGNYGDENTLKAVSVNTSGTLTIPWQAKGYTVVGIHQAAFMKCKYLMKLVLPSTMRTIGPFAFYECELLNDINLQEGIRYIESNAFESCKSLQEIILPSTMRIIYHNAFSYCTNLKSITIPKEVFEIESYAFFECKSLRKIYSYIEEPFVIKRNVFECSGLGDCDEVYKNAILYVPKGTRSKYKSTNYWNLFWTDEMETNGIQSPNYNQDNINKIFTIDGKEQEIMKKGINVIRYKNGKTKKIMVKE